MTIQVHTVYCKSYFKNQNYIIGQLRYFSNNLLQYEHQSKLKYIL